MKFMVNSWECMQTHMCVKWWRNINILFNFSCFRSLWSHCSLAREAQFYFQTNSHVRMKTDILFPSWSQWGSLCHRAALSCCGHCRNSAPVFTFFLRLESPVDPTPGSPSSLHCWLYQQLLQFNDLENYTNTITSILLHTLTSPRAKPWSTPLC